MIDIARLYIAARPAGTTSGLADGQRREVESNRRNDQLRSQSAIGEVDKTRVSDSVVEDLNLRRTHPGAEKLRGTSSLA